MSKQNKKHKCQFCNGSLGSLREKSDLIPSISSYDYLSCHSCQSDVIYFEDHIVSELLYATYNGRQFRLNIQMKFLYLQELNAIGGDYKYVSKFPSSFKITPANFESKLKSFFLFQ